jgi:hypothetical protein
MSSYAIMELRENSLVLWSLMSLSLSECGFGAQGIRVLYIPGKSSDPKPSEYLLALSFTSLYSLRKLASPLVFGGHSEKSHITGYDSFEVCAQGQNPSCRDMQTEFTNGQFGCVASKHSRGYTLMGVRLWKR